MSPLIHSTRFFDGVGEIKATIVLFFCLPITPLVDNWGYAIFIVIISVSNVWVMLFTAYDFKGLSSCVKMLIFTSVSPLYFVRARVVLPKLLMGEPSSVLINSTEVIQATHDPNTKQQGQTTAGNPSTWFSHHFSWLLLFRLWSLLLFLLQL